MVHIYNGILLGHKKEWNNVICNNMDGPRDCHTEQSKSARERQISYDITYVCNLKKEYKWTYLQNKYSHRCRKQTYGYHRGRGGGINWEIGIDIYTLWYIKQVTNKELLYGTGNSSQCSVMTCMGKESKKE